MATIVHGGIDYFNEMVYGQTPPLTRSFIQNINHSVSQVLTDTGRAFMDKVQQTYKAIDTSDITRRIKAAGRRISAAFEDNVVRQLHTVDDFQVAPLAMRRWLMAEPVTRELYHNQGCSGYGSTYNDLHPNVIGANHYDYRRVMNGVQIYEDEKEGMEGRIVYNSYHEDTTPADHLAAEDQISIIASWSRQRTAILERLRDPTDEYDQDL